MIKKGNLALPPSPNWYCPNIISCNNDGIVAYGARNDVVLLDILSQRILNLLEGHNERVTTVSFVGNRLISGSKDKSVILWDIEQKKMITQQHHVHKVSSNY